MCTCWKEFLFSFPFSPLKRLGKKTNEEIGKRIRMKNPDDMKDILGSKGNKMVGWPSISLPSLSSLSPNPPLSFKEAVGGEE